MKEGMNIGRLVQELERQAASKHDYLRRTTDLQFGVLYGDEVESEIGDLIVPGVQAALSWPGTASVADEAMPLAPLANTQLAEHLGIPTRYYNRLLVSHPALLEHNVNTLLQHAPLDEVRTLRTLDGEVRAFLSNSYDPIDNFTAVRYLLPLLDPENDHGVTLPGGRVLAPIRQPGGAPWQVDWKSANVSDTTLNIKFVIPTFERELKVGTVIRAGGILRNSEVGLHTFEFAPFTETLWCTNGAYYTRLGEGGSKRRHIGPARSAGFGENGRAASLEAMAYAGWKRQRDSEYLADMAHVIRKTLSGVLLDRVAAPIVAAMGAAITGNPAAAVETVGRILNLSGVEQEGVLRHLLNDGDLSMWGLSSAITRYSQEVGAYDRATALERMGGDVITLSKQDWRVISTAELRPRKRSAAAEVAPAVA